MTSCTVTKLVLETNDPQIVEKLHLHAHSHVVVSLPALGGSFVVDGYKICHLRRVTIICETVEEELEAHQSALREHQHHETRAPDSVPLGMLRGALLWLRNQYDVGLEKHKDRILESVDALLAESDVCIADLRAFHEWRKKSGR